MAFWGAVDHTPPRKRSPKLDAFMPPGWRPAVAKKQTPEELAASLRAMLGGGGKKKA